jgi:acyl carrier protein
VSQTTALEGAIADYIVQEFLYGEGEVSPEVDLFEERILDSFAFLQLLAWLGDTYGVEAEMRDITIDNFRTVRKIAAYAAARQG